MESFEGCVGVDGAKSNWLAVQLEQGRLLWHVHRDAESLVEAYPDARVIAVDIPIGLSERGARSADTEARRFVGGKRASSIFSSPVRGILDAESQPEASRRHRSIDGRGFGAQSFAILRKIREWDLLMQRDLRARSVVREIHPEVSFAALNGGPGLAESKRTALGVETRMRLLAGVFGDELVVQLVRGVRKREAATDDVLDAAVALWSASRIAGGLAVTLPSPVVPDSMGLHCAIWY